jgi:hypothetical protein
LLDSKRWENKVQGASSPATAVDCKPSLAFFFRLQKSLSSFAQSGMRGKRHCKREMSRKLSGGTLQSTQKLVAARGKEIKSARKKERKQIERRNKFNVCSTITKEIINNKKKKSFQKSVSTCDCVEQIEAREMGISGSSAREESGLQHTHETKAAQTTAGGDTSSRGEQLSRFSPSVPAANERTSELGLQLQ